MRFLVIPVNKYLTTKVHVDKLDWDVLYMLHSMFTTSDNAIYSRRTMFNPMVF